MIGRMRTEGSNRARVQSISCVARLVYDAGTEDNWRRSREVGRGSLVDTHPVPRRVLLDQSTARTRTMRAWPGTCTVSSSPNFGPARRSASTGKVAWSCDVCESVQDVAALARSRVVKA